MNYKKKLGKYFFEFLMLFAAVTAGFWVENYREEKNEKERMSKKLQAFVTEYHAVTDTSQFNRYYSYFLLPLMQVCDSARSYDNFRWSQHSIRYISMQRTMLESDFLDDLLRASSIADDDTYRHIEDDSLTAYFLKLNDHYFKNQRLLEAVYKLDDSLINILNDYKALSLLYNQVPTDSLELLLYNSIDSDLPTDELYDTISKDVRLRNMLGKIQIVHMDGHDLYVEVIKNTKDNLDRINAAIERLE